ncbi:MAG: bifunctional glutamate N-acetyltransferase/amino-acid acetyltransferase ArgJ [Planctomycetota bacterium]|nr:bifunctional glutamate N-acetyltransferase/amino-acid acetyltransferase ArgJ [Planctomycetota bacterium]
MNQVNETIYIPSGYSFSGVPCGLKQSAQSDLAVLVADQPCRTYGVFTQNLVRASSVDWNENRVGQGRALVINSGNANACTGKQGESDTETMARLVADQLDCELDDVFVMSTGIIGETLPMHKVEKGIRQAISVLNRGEIDVKCFAEAILTTDTFPKIVSKRFVCHDREYTVLGIAKGAGMIGPKMATMLGVLLTDFPLGSDPQHRFAFREVINRTFNCVSVDGHTSTSDQVLLFAPESLEPSRPESTSLFFEEMDGACESLAKMIPSDGEGAQHLITVEVRGLQAESELQAVARAIADSPLVKTAIFGTDPNWGRIVSAAGYSGIQFDPDESSLWLNGTLLFRHGTPVEFDARKVSQSLKDQFDAQIVMELGVDSGNLNSAKCWTSDLTYDYVRVNAEYHT